MAFHNELGKLGEQLAVDFLIKKGYQILEQNWRYKKAEIDIIAQQKNLLVIIEVKTRSTAFFGNPETFVTPSKIKLLIAAADAYTTQKDSTLEVRFDVIAILKTKNTVEINHILDCFFSFE